MRRHFSTLTMELFYYFTLISVFTVLLLWVFEILFLDSTYKIVRINQISEVGETIAQQIDSASLVSNIKSLQEEYDVIIYMIDIVTNETITMDNSLFEDNIVNADINRIYQISSSTHNGQSDVLFLNEDGSEILEANNVLSLVSNCFSITTKIKGLIYSTLESNMEGHPILVFVYGTIKPMDSAIEALRKQMAIISIVMVALTFVISAVCAKTVADPISELNEETKLLSKGDYDVDFTGTGYVEIVELSNTLNKLAKDLDDVDKMQKDLIANVSHDLRTPLTMISGYGEVMRDIPGENTPENLQVIIDEANRLTSLVNNLLDISKLQAGQVNLELDTCSTKEILKDVMKTYSRLMESKGYTIEVMMDSDHYNFICDKQRLQQAIYNIINNAINYCGEDKKVIINISKVEDQVRFEIIDNGPGIPEDKIDSIWKRHYRVENHQRPIAGSGLGLSIAKTVFDLHHANYGVKSKIGEGSTFWFELKLIEDNK